MQTFHYIEVYVCTYVCIIDLCFGDMGDAEIALSML